MAITSFFLADPSSHVSLILIVLVSLVLSFLKFVFDLLFILELVMHLFLLALLLDLEGNFFEMLI